MAPGAQKGTVGESAPLDATLRGPDDYARVPVRIGSTDGTHRRASLAADVVRRIRRVAAELDADVPFVGTANADLVATPVASVGSPISDDPDYDVHAIRHAEAGDR